MVLEFVFAAAKLHQNPYLCNMTRCYILFGSNQGDKQALLEEACSLINKRCGMLVERSSAYLSEPWGFEAEEWFLNELLVVETELDPDNLMDRLMEIEHKLGRVRHPSKKGYSSRTVDLDILYYGDQNVRTDKVTIPHPRLHLRRFALLPLCELIPDLLHPKFNVSQQQLLDNCSDASKVYVSLP
jgi:2-amino-4-hydroxy-6-hydroxymethyldihydropteridine diphosphokinase